MVEKEVYKVSDEKKGRRKEWNKKGQKLLEKLGPSDESSKKGKNRRR